MNYLYARASTSKQTASPDTQIELIRQYAKSIGEEIPDENVFVDRAVSATIRLDRRPAGSILCQRLKAGDNLFVMRLDRLFRKTKDIEYYLNRWVRNPDGEIFVHFVSYGGAAINGKTPMGRLILTILVGIAEFERDLISDRSREGLAPIKAKKYRITRDPGPGYKWKQIGRKANGSRLWKRVVDEDEMAAIDRFIYWNERGMSLDMITKHCKQNGIVRKFMRTKKVRDDNGKMVIPPRGEMTHMEVVEEPWTRASIWRGMQMRNAMLASGKKLEEDNDEEVQDP